MSIVVPEGYVYLDWAATTPLCSQAAEAMRPFLLVDSNNYALGMNANSLHAPGRAAFEAMERARREVARSVGASRPNEVLFCSGATEADNAAVRGIAHAALQRKRREGGSRVTGRFVTTQIEHEAVLSPAKALEREGFEVVRLKPDKNGFISVSQLDEALDNDTVLVSIQAANSEIGSIQPIAELARCAHRHGALFHTDATQALGKIPVDVSGWQVDAASFSAHKIGGPKGVGALYLKTRTPFEAQMLGGGQEDGRRSGTQNVCGIAGFAAACTAATENVGYEAPRQRALRDYLYDRLGALKNVKCTVAVAPGSDAYLCNLVHVLVAGMESETLILLLDRAGFGVSGGSACSSHSLEPSYVLRTLGIADDLAYNALRISIGRLTSDEDVRRFVEAFAECTGVG